MTGAAFSLLLPVYAGDRPEYFLKAFSSTVDAQTRPPAQVVVVQDGPVPEALSDAVRQAIASTAVPTVHEVIAENVGLAEALTRGLQLCDHDIVARMDADDISLPERFARQLPLIESGLDLIGTGMYEFLDDVGTIVGSRVPRTDAAEIATFARFADPFSHPTVVYRRSAVERAGGYQPLGLMEDYWLFARMIASGAKVGNIAEPLVMYRVGDGAYARRGGLAQWRSEMAIQRAFRSIGFTTARQYLRNVVVRGGYRFVPEALRKAAYRRVIARSE